MTYPTLEHVAMQARPYPSHLLEGCETGLVLFAAAFLGHNDAIHFAEAGIRTTCVDVDGERLAEMCDLYPSDWSFHENDAWRFVEACHIYSERAQWDVVSVDTFTGDMMHRSLASLDLWCSLARKVVTVTYVAVTGYEVPEGWQDSLYTRAGDVYWLVLERA